MNSRGFSVIWPLLIIIVAALWIYYSIGALPGPAIDLLSRAWPVIFVAVGLMLLLGRRLRFGNFIAIVLSLLVVGGMTAAAYNRQSGRLVTDSRKPFEQPIDPQTTTVNINVTTLLTEIEIKPGDSAKPGIIGEFVGSRESKITSDYQSDGATGTFTFVEAQSSALPSLAGMGRGKLTLSVPIGPTVQQLNIQTTGRGNVQLDATGTTLTSLSINAGAGKITFVGLPASLTDIVASSDGGSLEVDGSATALKNLKLAANAGNVSLKLPEKSGLIAEIRASGDVELSVPPTIAANIKLVNGAANSPTYSQADYIMNIDKVLVSIRAKEPQMQITINSGGRATVQ